MAAMKGKGTQKEARLERLKAEIATYIDCLLYTSPSPRDPL